MRKNLLIVFAKEPVAGKVKTRLAKTIGFAKAAAIYALLSKSILRKLLSPGYDLVIYKTPESNTEYFKSLFPDIRIANQVYGNIGQKMYSALCAEYKQRYQKICLIGTDCPDLTPSIILRAFKHLTAHSVVIGPAKDGGYYLLGLKQPLKEIFMKIPWSTPQVCEMTLARLRQINSQYKLLEMRQDIDDYQDLKTYLQKPKNLRLKQILLEILKQ